MSWSWALLRRAEWGHSEELEAIFLYSQASGSQGCQAASCTVPRTEYGVRSTVGRKGFFWLPV